MSILSKLRLLLFLLSWGSLSSCAVIFNHPVKNLRIHTERPSKIYYTNVFGKADSMPTINNSADIFYKRSKESLNLLVKDDSLKHDVWIDSRASSAHVFTWLYCWPLAIIETHYPKSRRYPADIYVTPSTETLTSYKMLASRNRKGTWYAQISIPEVNAFHFKPAGHGTQNRVGCFGLSAGIEYYHSDKQFLSLSVAAPLDFETFLPFPTDYAEVHESAASIYASLTNNHHFKRFYAGYGLSLSRNAWGLLPGMHTTPDDYTVQDFNTSVGLAGNVYVRLTQSFSVGVIYRPSFYRFYGPDKFAYEHLISLDLKWRIRLN